MNVIVLGSINMDLVIKTDVFPKQGETVLGTGFFTSPGGKGANQATAIGKMGVSPIFIGCVGKDVYGKALIDKLKQNHVETSNIKMVEQNTGVACITLFDHDNRIILDAGANHVIHKEDISLVLEKHSKNTIFLTQFENNMDACIYGLEKAKALKMFTILNPAPFIKTDKCIYKNLDCLVLNESECESLVEFCISSKEKQLDALKIITNLGVKSIILTLGAKGSVFYKDDIVTHINASKTNVMDTTCAGDAYIGAYVSKIAKGKGHIEACIFASKVAAMTVSKEGAQESIPVLEMIELK